MVKIKEVAKVIEINKIEVIINTVCDYLNIQAKQLLKNCRDEEVVKARDFVIYLLRLENMTFSEIGRKINKNRTTVSYSAEKIEARIQYDKIWRNQLFEIKDLVFDNSEECLETLLDREAEMMLNWQNENQL